MRVGHDLVGPPSIGHGQAGLTDHGATHNMEYSTVAHGLRACRTARGGPRSP